LDITVSAEVELIRILNENKKIHEHEPKGWDTIHQNDKPNRIALLPRVDPPKVQPILNRLESIIEKKQDDWQVQVIK
jgi:hypothetical protein